MMYSNIPTDMLVHQANHIRLEWGVFWYLRDIEWELESRIPVFEKEYDSEGNLIISEVMGYTNEGEEIWS